MEPSAPLQNIDFSLVIQQLNNIKDSTTRDTYLQLLKIETEKKAELIQTKLNKEFSERKRGQVFAFLVIVLGFLFACVFIFFGHTPEAAITSLITSSFPCALAGVKGFLK